VDFVVGNSNKLQKKNWVWNEKLVEPSMCSHLGQQHRLHYDSIWLLNIMVVKKIISLVYLLLNILYINSVSPSVRSSVKVLKPRSLLVKLSPRTRGPKNYSRPRVFTSYFYFYVRFRTATTGGLCFLLLFLRPFLCSNCRRRWGRYFWDLEGGWGDLSALFWG